MANSGTVPLLIVTSANLPGEPLLSDNLQALKVLHNMADWVVTHDRDILFATDDSVLQSSNHFCPPLMIRRARGFAPEPLAFQVPVNRHSTKTVLACGAYLKNTFCLSHAQQAFTSTHLGEQNSLRSYQQFEQHLDNYLQQFELKPDIVACDLHPDFFSSRFAEDYAKKHQLPLIKVAHHEAHIASVLNDCQLPADTPFLALALDGLGLGSPISKSSPNTPTHSLRGGELYYGKLTFSHSKQTDWQLQHISHLNTLLLPGGDKASQQISRIGFALKQTLPKRPVNCFEDFSTLPANLKQFIKLNLSSFEETSSLGRWFDGVAALLGVCQYVSYEGQAAMELEALARHYNVLPKAKHLARIEQDGRLNLYPVLPYLLTSISVQEAAARFHSELVDGLLRWLIWGSLQFKAIEVICSGGCFQNKILREQLCMAETKSGLKFHFPKQIAVNDAGISIGQAWIATIKTSSP